jgi:hypothetical protein
MYEDISVELNLADLHDEVVQEGLVNEATRFAVAPTGTYLGIVTKFTAQQYLEDAPYNAGRKTAKLHVQLSKEDGTKVSKVFPELSWEPVRYENGKLDKLFTLFSQLAKAVNVMSGGPAAVLQAATENQVQARVTLNFKVLVSEIVDNDLKEYHIKRGRSTFDEVWVSIPENDEDNIADAYYAKGLEPRNFVQSFSRLI